MIDGDIGKTFGRLSIASSTGRENYFDRRRGIAGLDYIDLGELIAPPGVVPVVIKSLLFA